MSLLTDVKRGVATGTLSINEGRALLLEHEHGGGYDPAETWQSVLFFVAMVCLMVVGFGLELLLAWR